MGSLEAKQVLLATGSSFRPPFCFYYTVEDTSNKKSQGTCPQQRNSRRKLLKYPHEYYIIKHKETLNLNLLNISIVVTLWQFYLWR